MSDSRQGPASIRDVLVEGMDLFESELDRVTAHDWANATPCADWTVADLVRHAADTADRASAFLRDQAWQASESASPARERWSEAGGQLRKVLAETALDDRWPLPSDSPHAKLLFHGCDFTVHRWDLAVARGEEAELPAAWVSFMDSFFRSVPAEVLRRPRAFSDPLEPADGDGPTRRLMAFLGRRPLPA